MTDTHRVRKPVGTLSHTDWLTDAHDAEPGMELVIANGTTIRRFEIGDVAVDTIIPKNHKPIPAQYINRSRKMVIE